MSLRNSLIKLAHDKPEFQDRLLPLLKEGQDFPPEEIGEVEPGPLVDEPDEPYMEGEFTQQEFTELSDLQESGALEDAVADEMATERALRSSLIRMAKENPSLRAKLLPLLKE